MIHEVPYHLSVARTATTFQGPSWLWIRNKEKTKKYVTIFNYYLKCLFTLSWLCVHLHAPILINAMQYVAVGFYFSFIYTQIKEIVIIHFSRYYRLYQWCPTYVKSISFNTNVPCKRYIVNCQSLSQGKSKLQTHLFFFFADLLSATQIKLNSPRPNTATICCCHCGITIWARGPYKTTRLPSLKFDTRICVPQSFFIYNKSNVKCSIPVLALTFC